MYIITNVSDDVILPIYAFVERLRINHCTITNYYHFPVRHMTCLSHSDAHTNNQVKAASHAHTLTVHVG